MTSFVKLIRWMHWSMKNNCYETTCENNWPWPSIIRSIALGEPICHAVMQYVLYLPGSNYEPARINGENAGDLTTISRVVVYRVTETRYNDWLSGEQFYGLPHCVSETRQTCWLTLGRIFSSNVDYRKTSRCWTCTDRRQTSFDLENTARSAGRYKKKKRKQVTKYCQVKRFSYRRGTLAIKHA